MTNILDIFDEVIDNLCHSSITRKAVLDNYQQITVIVDDMIDNGLVFNTDSENIEYRLKMKEYNKQVTPSNEGGYFKSVISIFYDC